MAKRRTAPSAALRYVPVSSSAIQAIAYDDTEQTLGVRFQSGTEYWYFQVPESVFEAFLAAGSVGQYFDDHIRDAGYDYRRVR